MTRPARLAVAVLLCAIFLHWVAESEAQPPPETVRYEHDRLTVRATDVPLDRLLAEIAAVTKATIRGSAPSRPVSADFRSLPLREGLTRLFGEESFMLTYGSDGTLRTIDLLGRGVGGTPSPAITTTPSPRPPLADEEAQAKVLRGRVPVDGVLAEALGTATPTIGEVLHATLREPRAAARAAAREAALDAFARDPAAEAAYLSTLVPVDDAVLADMFRRMAAADGSAEEWMAALSARAPSVALREKASAVLDAMRR